MHGGGWFGMGLYWQLPILILVVVMVALLFARRRSGGAR